MGQMNGLTPGGLMAYLLLVVRAMAHSMCSGARVSVLGAGGG